MKIKWMMVWLALIGLMLTGCEREAVQVAAPPADVAAGETELWMTDVDGALARAAAENKFLIFNFSGQQWCSWCRLLDKEVFVQPLFEAYAKENLICVLLDFSRSGRPVSAEFAERHDALLARYQIQGFPTVLILNPEGRVIERTGYRRGGAEAYIAYLKETIAGAAGK